MKNLLLSTTMLAILALTGCSTTGVGTSPSTGTNTPVGAANNIGMSVFKAAIDNQCRSQIEKQPAWRIASAAMTDAQEELIQDKVCSCVSEQAPQQVTLVELGNAAIDADYRGKLVTQVVAKSLQSCYANFMR